MRVFYEVNYLAGLKGINLLRFGVTTSINIRFFISSIIKNDQEDIMQINLKLAFETELNTLVYICIKHIFSN